MVKDALDKGYLDSGAEYPVPGIVNHDAANEARRSVRTAGQHLGVAVAAWVTDSDGNPCYRNCQDPNAEHGIKFKLHNKTAARAHVVKESGGNPANLKYNPFQRGEPRLIDDQGKRIR